MRLPALIASLTSLTLTASALAAPTVAVGAQPAAPPRSAVDYAQPSVWLCRPGRADACGKAQLDAVAVDASGARTPAPFHAAAAPKLDCFYVYPTVSTQPTDFSDMTGGPEEARVAASQFARFASVCRPFAPLYRQFTLPGLMRAMSATPARTIDWTPAYADVLAAWRAYLAHDNGGHGVVLIGHSQGAILLQRLLAEEIDGKPAQRRLVSAFLAGDPGLETPVGAATGGTLKTIPLCAARSQTGCVYVWASYAADDAEARRLFGHDPGRGLQAACVDPAGPGGGRAPLTSYLRKPAEASDSDPPWVELAGGYTAECRGDAQGHVLRVAVAPGAYADLRARFLTAVRRPGWGLHPLDIGLAQGSMIEDVKAQAAAWTAAHP